MPTPVRPRVLLVEDDDAIVELLRLLLPELELVQATEWADVVRVYYREGCGLVLMDINLPKLGGHRLAVALKKVLPPHPTPVHFFSAEEPDRMRALVASTGADGWISKRDGGDAAARRIRVLLEARS